MNAPSLNGFLTMTGAQYRLFDLGTAVRKLPDQVLQVLDQGEHYPYPHLGYAWLAIFMWNPEQKEQNSLWFMKLPLDELGILNAGVHSDLVNRFYRGLQAADVKERQRLFTEHPYQFKPDDEKMAALHARATKLLGLPTSEYFTTAADFYYQADTEVQWQNLGIQGIAELVCRADERQLAQLSSRLSELDDAPLIALLQQLEHRSLPSSTVEAIRACAEQYAHNQAIEVACLRAVSQSPAHKLMLSLIEKRLQQGNENLEFLLTVLTRYPQLMLEEKWRMPVLNALAKSTDPVGFSRVMTNLAMQPGLQGIVMQTLASDKLSAELGTALGQLIQSLRGNHERH